MPASVSQFPIRPGLHTHVIKLPDAALVQHMYLHVAGVSPDEGFITSPTAIGPHGSFYTDQVCYWKAADPTGSDTESACDGRDNDLDGKVDEGCSAGLLTLSCSAAANRQVPAEGADADAPEYARPWRFVPFMTPVYDRAATEFAKAAAHEQGAATPAPVYRWVYGPEYHFSLLDLEQVKITRTDAEGDTHVLEDGAPSPSDSGFLAGGDQSLDLVWILNSDPEQELERFDGPREIGWQLGDVTVYDDGDGHLSFQSPADVAKLGSDDLLALQLVQGGDEANVLWKYDFKTLDYHLADSVTRVNRGQTVTAIADPSPADEQVGWQITARDRGVRADVTRSGGQTARIHADKESAEGYVTLEAYFLSNPALKVAKRVKIGCSCESCEATGTCEHEVASVHVRWSLGKTHEGVHAGTLFLESDTISAALGKPSALTFSTLARDIEAVYASGALRQVLSATSLLDVRPTSDSSFELRFYEADARGARAQDGTYAISSTAQPIAHWVVSATADAITVHGEHDGRVEDFAYRTDPQTGELVMDDANGARLESHQETRSGADRVVRRKIKDATGTVVSDTLQRFRVVDQTEEMIEQTVDPDGTPMTTRYTYHPAPIGGYARIQSIEYPDGSWASYAYDERGRITLESAPYLDGELTSPDQARTTSSSYDRVDPRDSLHADDADSPRTVIERIGGIEVSRTYYAFIQAGAGERTEIVERASAAGAAYGAPGNLRTTTVYAAQDAARREPRRVRRVEYADGRLDTTVHETGVWSAGSFRPGAGRARRETVTHAAVGQEEGVSGLSTRDVRIEDAYGNLVREELWTNVGASYVLASWTQYRHDRQGRVIRTERSNGTVTSASWGCCGYSSSTDEQGITTTYTYDDLGRLETEERDGVTTTHHYDAAGREVRTERTSADGTLTTSRAYDAQGRIIRATDEAGLVTTTSYSADGRTTTVTRPGGATEVTTTHRDGRVASVSGTGVVAQTQSYSINSDGTQTTETRLALDATFRERTSVDLLGRTIRTERPAFGAGTEVSTQTYDGRGRLVASSSPGVATTRYVYDALGNQTRTALDLDDNGRIDLDGSDRVQDSLVYYTLHNDGVWQEQLQRVFPNTQDPTPVTVSTQRTRLGGFSPGVIAEAESVDLYGNLTRSRTLLNAQGSTVTQILDVPDSDLDSIQISIAGKLIASTSVTGLTVAFAYDAFGRRTAVIDPRTGTALTHYDDKGRVLYVEDAAGNRTSFAYDPATGRKVAETNPLAKVTRFAYTLRGELARTWGDVPYPVLYEYDLQGRRTRMHTFRQPLAWNGQHWPEDATGDITSWDYDPATGLLVAKRDAAGQAVRYAYGTAGRLASRTWARTVAGQPVVTTYQYDDHTAELRAVDYSDQTPDVTFEYDRLGRTATVHDATGARSFAYDPATIRLVTETATGIAPAAITHKAQTTGLPGRAAGFTLGANYDVTYDYDAHGRLGQLAWAVQGQSDVATYTRVPSSELLAGVAYGSGVAVAYGYEAKRDLKTQVKNSFGASTISQYDYAYDALGRRTSVANSGSAFASAAFNKWQYNDRNELIDSGRYLGTDVANTNSPVAAEHRDYGFDPIGNRTTATEGSEQKSYQANLLNEYTSVGGATLTYDADGNLTSDGSRKFTYDAENRLTLVEPVTSVNGSTRVKMAYDYLGRRVQKLVEEFDGSAWAAQDDVRFVYLGWNVIEERHTSAGVSTKKNFVWGLDLSQSMDGAGGIGGLLAVVDDAGSQMAFLYDANGNVGQLVDEAGSVVARYEYDAFGNVLVAEGSAANDNAYRFSTKYADQETGLVYYGKRMYMPQSGRWLNRDPLGEAGGLNLFAFVANNPVWAVDPLGLEGLIDQIIFNNVVIHGQFEPGLPQEFLRHYMTGTGEPFHMSAARFLSEVWPLSSVFEPNAFGSGFTQNLKADVAKHCGKCLSAKKKFRGFYKYGAFDGGHRTGGMGRFVMQADVEVTCHVGGGAELYGTAWVLPDMWDFDWAWTKLWIDLETNGVSLSQDDLSGRERRTAMGSAIPGKGFPVIVDGDFRVHETTKMPKANYYR